MASITPSQRAAFDGMVSGSFDSLNPSLAEMYAGTYPPASTSPSRSLSAPPSYLTPSQLAAIQAVPSNSYQWPKNTAINKPNEPTGYSFADTGNAGRATPAMQQLIALTGSTSKPVGGAAAVPNNAGWGQFEQAYTDAGSKPGTWMAQSRMQAQALMRQMAVQNAAGGGTRTVKQPAAVAVPGAVAAQPSQPPSLFDLLFGGSTQGTSSGGLAGLLTQPAAQPYGGRYTPQQLADRTAQGIAIGNANRASPTPTHDVAGNNNAFMSTNHQNSTRWQTGY